LLRCSRDRQDLYQVIGTRDLDGKSKHKMVFLTSPNISSLVVDTLCDRARGQNAAVACFYFDYAAQKEQSPISILGSLLKQVVGGWEKIPGGIVKAFEDQKKVIGGRGLRLHEIVEMLETASSSQHTFICIDALDECVAVHRLKVLRSLKQILLRSPRTRIFLTGRAHIRGEVEKGLAGGAAILSISPKEDDIVTFLRAKLDEDTNPDAMDDRLEADIMRKIPQSISEMYVFEATTALKPFLSSLLTGAHLDSY